MLILSTNAGALFGFAISLFLDYYGQLKINLLIPTLFLVLYHFFPETPEYLLKRNQKKVRLLPQSNQLLNLFGESP